MTTPLNRAKIVSNGEDFPIGMAGIYLAAGGDVTVEFSTGKQHTYTGLPAGFHAISAAKLVSGGPLEARWWEPDVAPIGGIERPAMTSPLLWLESTAGISRDGNKVRDWESQNPPDIHFGLKDEFSTLPDFAPHGPFVDFPGVAALEASGFGPASSGECIVYLGMKMDTPQSEWGVSIDNYIDGETGVGTGNALRVYRNFGSGELSVSNEGTIRNTPYVVVPGLWAQVTVQFHATAAYVRVNGVEVDSGFAMPSGAVQGMTLGHGSVSGGTAQKHASLAFVAVGDAAPTAQERDDIEAYIVARYKRGLDGIGD